MRYLKWSALTLTVVAAIAVLTFYVRPLFVIAQVIRFQLFRGGAHGHYAKVCVQSGCYQLPYYVAGDGPPVVRIHGVGGSGENWANIFAAIKNAGFRVYLPDLLGFGRSERPDVDYSMPLQAAVMKAFLLQQGITAADVGGTSMGGWVALEMAVRYPDSVRRLLLFDSAGTNFAPTFQPSLFEPHSTAELQKLFDLLTPRPTKMPGYVARDMIRTMAPSGWVIQRAVNSMFSKRDVLDAQLSQLALPTLIVWGRQDHLIPLATGEYLRSRIAGSELHAYNGCGHLILEACGPQITPEVIGFLRSGKPN